MSLRGLLPLATALTLFAAPALAAPKVMVTIKPLHSLAAAVMEGVGEPALLIEGAGSPHGYSLRPSEAAALDEAELVVWVGPALESFLQAPLEALAGDARVLEAMEVEGVTLLPQRAGGEWQAHDHHHGHDHDHGDEHAEEEGHDHDADHAGEAQAGEAGADPHLWLDPRNGAMIAAALARSLAEMDPENAARYAANARALQESLALLEQEIAARLEPVGAIPYIVFHDAYHYFEDRFGLSPAGSATVSPDRTPGARRLAELRARIQDLGAVCVFHEPQFAPALLDTLTEGFDLRTGSLDPLGQDLPAGPGAYSALLRGLAENLADCLRPAT